MAIDTDSKRKAVINFSLPGLVLLPKPDGSIDAGNRRQMTDSYPISAQVIGRNIWVQDKDSSETWVPDTDLTQIWRQDQDMSHTWVQDKEVEES